MRSSLILFAVTAFPTLAAAQTPPPANPPAPLWERKAEFALVSTDGNTNTQTLGLGGSLVYRPGDWTTEARTAFVRTENADVETAKSFIADLRESLALTPRLEAFGRFGYLVDRFAGIERRSTLDGGLGYKLLTGPVHTLRADAGLGYSRESRITGNDQSFPLANFGGAYRFQPSKTTDITNAAIATAALNDGDAWRFSNAFALTAAVAGVFSLKLSHDLKFNNAPVAGFKKTDRLMSVALVAKF